MKRVFLSHHADFEGWRTAARTLAAERVPPEDIVWEVRGDPPNLFATDNPSPTNNPAPTFTVPRAFLTLAENVTPHHHPERYPLLYTTLLRLIASPTLIDDTADPMMFRLRGMAKSVARDIHKMRAFVRFRSIGLPGDERFVAWFEPEHHIVRANAGFFERRFAKMKWSILTPQECAHWDTQCLLFTPGATWRDAPNGDDLEATWKTYYAAIFNPARLKISAMLKEMPKKYWRNMPETALVPHLIEGAQAREAAMIERSSGTPTLSDVAGAAVANLPALDGEVTVSLADVAQQARSCKRCPLYASATHTVFGEGPMDATLMFVGEQPGDQEDIAGRPFVGPAGQVFDRALTAAGIERSTTYVTNAVKHFKFEQRGKRRIHAKPDAGEIEACLGWLKEERRLVRPRLTVALGATAARSLTGRTVTISRERGRPLVLTDGGKGFITIHPSYLLRLDDRTAADAEFERFVEDLKAAAVLAAS